MRNSPHILLAMFLLASAAGEGIGKQQPVTVPAEQFTRPRAGSAGNEGWVLDETGEVMCVFDFPESARYTFILVAKGDMAGDEPPVMKITAEGRLLAEEEVRSERWATYTVQASIASGTHEIAIAFVNDFFDGKQDRNLYLRSLTVVPSEGVETPRPVSRAETEELKKQEAADVLARLDDSIDKVRKTRLRIRIVDAEGRPVSGAKVQVRQMKQNFLFGTALCSSMFNEGRPDEQKKQYLDYVKTHFNHAVTENALKWNIMQPTREEFHDEDLNGMVIWCAENGMPLRGHCVFWGCEEQVPAWARDLADDELRSEIAGRARIIAKRYKDLIDEFDVNNEMLHCTYFKDRLGETIHRQMFHEMKSANPEVVLYVNDFGVLNGADLSRYVHQIRGMLKEGVPLGGIGVQGHFGGPVDPVKVQEALDTLAQFDLPIKITEFDCSSKDEAVQAEALKTLYRIAFAHPSVKAILMWGFWEGCHWRPDAAMLREDFSPKPAARVYDELVLKRWRTNEEGRTNKNGEFVCRAFLGTLRVDVLGPEGGKLARRVSLDTPDKAVSIALKLPKASKSPKKGKAEPADNPDAPMGW
ncbi:MAG: endo-1,4-beta-xylanase [Verrucomicrobia bacterium]|nr:endo-1,4-beta-xylanase [Verrucomicrobiota bacterium]